MKDKKYQITTIILSVVTILLSGYIVTDKLIAKEPSEANSTSNVDNPESMEDKISSDEICSFTKTHHIIDLLEDYQGEVPEMTFILVDHFQNHYPIVLGMPNTLKKELKENKYYEFTYTVPKNNNYDDENEILSDMVQKLINNDQSDVNHNINLIIKETNKLGLEQINEEICK